MPLTSASPAMDESTPGFHPFGVTTPVAVSGLLVGLGRAAVGKGVDSMVER
jgi:hypothetical protein